MTPEQARRSYQQIVEAMLAELRGGGVITDTAPGSVARTLVEATARELSELHARMHAVYRAGFIDTATDAALDQLVAMLGITRRSGDAATLELRALRDARISARVIVPPGTQVAVERVRGGRALYRVTDAFEIAEGEAARVIVLQAAPPEGGTLEDVAVGPDDVAGGVASFLRPIAGVAGLEFTGPSVALAAREDDAALRARARMAIAAAGGGTEKALSGALLAIEGIRGVRLRDAGDPVEGQPLRPGELEIVLDAERAEVERNLERIRAAIEGAKGPGIVARLRTTARRSLGGRLVIRPAGPLPSAEAALALIEGCDAVIAGALSGLGIGEGLVWNRLLARLMAVDGVGDVVVAASVFRIDGAGGPPGDITVAPTERLVPDPDAGLPVVLEDRPVLTLALRVAFAAPQPGTDATAAVTAEVAAALGRHLEALRAGAAAVSVQGVVAALLGPDGITAFADALDAVAVAVTDGAEGTEVTLSTGGRAELALPPDAVLRLAATPVRVTWAEAP